MDCYLGVFERFNGAPIEKSDLSEFLLANGYSEEDVNSIFNEADFRNADPEKEGPDGVISGGAERGVLLSLLRSLDNISYDKVDRFMQETKFRGACRAAQIFADYNIFTDVDMINVALEGIQCTFEELGSPEKYQELFDMAKERLLRAKERMSNNENNEVDNENNE